ncbi:MAG: FtsW/RodA/SpoVE family cell cycle protein [Streptococcaceae bacterium]|jgi:cell division protein FtsW|nr:FtsW/RodA/SpoVE family cell cycle protein [Streptococcaceae bacterium]
MQTELRKTNFLDFSILIPYLILAVFGLIMVFSTTVPTQLEKGANLYRPIISQSIFFVLSLIGMFIVFRIKLRAIKSQRLIAIVMLVLVFLLIYSRFGPGTYANGAHGWIPIPGVGTIQPAEFAKLFMIWYLSSVFATKQKEIRENDITAIFDQPKWYQNIYRGWRAWILLMLLIELIMPDLGNTIIMGLIALVLIASSGISFRWATGYGKFFVFLILAFFALLFMTGGNLIPGSYINKRLLAFVNPFRTPAILADAGHQIANGYYAISNGGWFGRGLGNSIEKNGYLPFASTDFVFPVVVEELGVIGAVLILCVLFFLILRIYLVGIRARYPFNAMIAIGVGTMLLMQTFVNVGGAIGLIPETGVTFPFLSQGGSSLFVLSLAVALVLNVESHERLENLNELQRRHERNRPNYKK